ncbi:MAG TPA: serine hydrolase [Chloroflexota bacterium]|nr:serine hydrolase [Chloroflexota bacterium]
MRGASRVLLVAAITGSLGVLLTGVLRPGVSDAPDPPLVTDATLNTSGGAPPGTPASMPPAWSAAHAIAAAAQSARPQAAEAAPEAPVPAPDAAPQASTPGEMDSPAAQAAPAADAPHDAAAADPLEIGGLIEDAALAALVQQHLAPLRGVFGVAIKDLDSGRGVLINADRMLPAASLFKLAVMYEVFRQHDAGQLQLTERLTLSAHYAQYDLGTLDLPVGSVLSIQDALERMITRSDNSTANLLLDRVGVANVNATMRALGLEATRIAREQLTTSAHDMLRLLERIARGQGPSAASSAAMLQLLLAQRVNDRLPAQLPPGTPVAHKTGNLPGIVHDVGIVYAPGATFVIALLAAEAPEVGAVTQAEATLARAVYDYFTPAAP